MIRTRIVRGGLLALAGVVAVLAASCAAAATPPAAPSSAAPSSAGVPSAQAPSTTVPATAGPARSATPTIPSTSPSASRIAGWRIDSRLAAQHGGTHLLPAGSGFLVVGDDNVCTPGGAWETSPTAELRDAAGSWRLVDPLPAPRDGFAAVTLSDGRVLVAGGSNENNRSYSSAYIFDAASGSWAKTGLLNTARSEPFAVVLTDGRVLVGGGFFIDADQAAVSRTLSSTELFDPATGTWTGTGSLATPRSGASAVLLSDGRVLAVGGSRRSDAAPGTTEDLASAETYDPQTGRWSPAGSLHAPRSGSTLVALDDGGALIVGGSVLGDSAFGQANFHTDTAERFDARSRQWSAAGTLTVAASNRTAVRLADGRVLVAGGDVSQVVDLVHPGYTTSAEIYDPTSGAWSPTVPLPGPRADARAVLLPDGSVLLAGGFSAPPSNQSTPSCPTADPTVLRYILR